MSVCLATSSEQCQRCSQLHRSSCEWTFAGCSLPPVDNHMRIVAHCSFRDMDLRSQLTMEHLEGFLTMRPLALPPDLPLPIEIEGFQKCQVAWLLVKSSAVPRSGVEIYSLQLFAASESLPNPEVIQHPTCNFELYRFSDSPPRSRPPKSQSSPAT